MFEKVVLAGLVVVAFPRPHEFATPVIQHTMHYQQLTARTAPYIGSFSTGSISKDETTYRKDEAESCLYALLAARSRPTA